MQKNLEKRSSAKTSLLENAVPAIYAGNLIMKSKKELAEENKEGTPIGWAMDNPILTGLLATMLAGYLKQQRDKGTENREVKKKELDAKIRKVRSFRQ